MKVTDKNILRILAQKKFIVQKVTNCISNDQSAVWSKFVQFGRNDTTKWVYILGRKSNAAGCKEKIDVAIVRANSVKALGEQDTRWFTVQSDAKQFGPDLKKILKICEVVQ